MSPLFIYLLKASATVFILWAFYYVVPSPDDFSQTEPLFLSGRNPDFIAMAALPLTEWFSKAPQVNQVVVYIPVSAFMMQFKPETPAFGFEMAFKIVYFAGIAVYGGAVD